jgi:hypothetical protein
MCHYVRLRGREDIPYADVHSVPMVNRALLFEHLFEHLFEYLFDDGDPQSSKSRSGGRRHARVVAGERA